MHTTAAQTRTLANGVLADTSAGGKCRRGARSVPERRRSSQEYCEGDTAKAIHSDARARANVVLNESECAANLGEGAAISGEGAAISGEGMAVPGDSEARHLLAVISGEGVVILGDSEVRHLLGKGLFIGEGQGDIRLETTLATGVQQREDRGRLTARRDAKRARE